jgi:hypothetical protein
MDNQRWPKLAMEEELDRRNKNWMKENKMWLSKCNIKLHECPNTKEEIKKFVKKNLGLPCGPITVGVKKHTTSRSLTQIVILVRKHT